MDLRVLRVFQRTLADQCSCWGLIVFDASGVAVGCAALCMFKTELIESKNPSLVRWRDRLRRIWPGMGKMKVLFCGLPVPSGSTHLRVRTGASPQNVIDEVDRAMRNLAQTTGSRLIVFKELDKMQASLATMLGSAGYVRGAIPPMHLLDVSFINFASYRDSLKSRYRAQILRSQKKLLLAGFEMLSGRGNAFFATYFDAHAHRLYRAVHHHAAQKLELMPLSFFLGLAAELDNEVLLTLIRREGRVCAFTFSVTRAGTHYNLYSGLDYALNSEGDLYFNLFYHDMDQAFRSNATSLHLGQTSDAFKSRLGTRTQDLYFFARALPSALNGALRIAAPLVFPKVAAVERHDVFTASRR